MSGRSAIVCEVCKGRVRHDGKSIVVGMRRTGRKRMVCGDRSCLATWNERVRERARAAEEAMTRVAGSKRIPAMGMAILQNRVWSPLNKRNHGWISALARELKKTRPDLFASEEASVRAAIHRVLKEGPPPADLIPVPVGNLEPAVASVEPAVQAPKVEDEPKPKSKSDEILEAMRGLPGNITYTGTEGTKCYALARVIRASVNYLAEVGDMDTLKALASLSTEAVVK